MAVPPLTERSPDLPEVPAWVRSGKVETLENVAYRAGAALVVLDALMRDIKLPGALLANTLALRAAAATSKLEGRMSRATDIRDAFHLTLPGEARGPDGDGLAWWREAVRLPLDQKRWLADLGVHCQRDITEKMHSAQVRTHSHGPIAGCLQVMRDVLRVNDRDERVACVLGDVTLARAVGWKHPVPLCALNLSKPMLRELCSGDVGAEVRIGVALVTALCDTVTLARTLTQRAANLQRVAPKLRARGSAEAVAVFLREDAVAPGAMLSPRIRGTDVAMTPRAARRFCDRLVQLGVARELTGRATFRLYGLAT